ncbi:Copia protein, partial [Mucuna pruriens]
MTSFSYASGVGNIMYGMVHGSFWTSSLGSIETDFKRKLHDEEAIKGYVDSNYAGNIDTRKSLSGYIFTLFSTAISGSSWLSHNVFKKPHGLKSKCNPSLKNQIYHEKSKHIDVKLHFIQDVIETKEIFVEKVATEDKLANAFTKSLPLLIQTLLGFDWFQ